MNMRWRTRASSGGHGVILLMASVLSVAAAAGRPLRAQSTGKTGADSLVVRQSGESGGSLITQLTARGANALNDFDYRQADSLARTVLNLGVPLTSEERRSALQLLIASLFPDDPAQQKLDSAKIFIKQYVEAGAHTIASGISWRGLDSLVALFARPAVPATLRIGSRVPGAVLYVNGEPRGPLSGVRAIPIPSGSSVAVSVRADQCTNADSSLLLEPSDSLTLGFVNPRCAGLPPTWRNERGSIVDDLLQRAQDAVQRLDYSGADSLARSALATGPTVSDGQRERALFIMAAAAFPDELPARQHRAQAMADLEQVVRSDLEVTLPWELAWPGLAVALHDAKSVAFGISVSADSVQSIVGPDGTGAITVHANRPARFVVRIAPAGGGPPVVVDSAGPATDTTVHFHAMRDGVPVFLSADYEVTILARDQNGDTATTHRVANVVAPMLTLQTPPERMDSTKLLPERSPRYGWRGLFTGLVLGGGVYGVANYMTADSLHSGIPVDSKAMPVAIGVVAAVLVASAADPGRVIPANQAANARLRAAFDKSKADVLAANRAAVANYRTTITLQPGLP